MTMEPGIAATAQVLHPWWMRRFDRALGSGVIAVPAQVAEFDGCIDDPLVATQQLLEVSQQILPSRPTPGREIAPGRTATGMGQQERPEWGTLY